MSIYKVSNMQPQLKEVDLNNDNEFTAQINTSGEPVKAYKMQILSGNGEEIIYDPIQPTKLVKPVKNANILKIENINRNIHDDGKDFINGKDYQWGLRVYNQEPGSEDRPNTVVCDGFEVGSTKNVIWTRIDKDYQFLDDLRKYNDMPTQQRPSIESYFQKYDLDTRRLLSKLYQAAEATGGILTEEQISEVAEQDRKIMIDQLQYDRYIEFNVDSVDSLILGAKDESEKTYPKVFPYRQRKKIDWVDKDLGNDKDIEKIETVDPFDYNYIDGTPYSIYTCSDEHTVNSFFSDPNSSINVADFVVVYYNLEDAIKDRNQGGKPGNYKVQPAFKERKIVGYSSDTGEIRVDEPFEYAPINKMAYRIFKYDMTNDSYEEVVSTNEGAYVETGTKYYNKSATILQGDYYSDFGCTQRVGTILNAKDYSFNYSSGDYITIRRKDGTGNTYYSYSRPGDKVPSGTPYYSDESLTKKVGTIGYQFNMKDKNTSTITIDGIRYYIDTPRSGELVDGSVIFSDTSLTKVSHVLQSTYYYRTNVYSQISVNGATYYIKTPTTGSVEINTPAYGDKELTNIMGIYGAKYTLTSSEVARISVKSSNYFVKVSDLGRLSSLPKGTPYYDDIALTKRSGAVNSDSQEYTIVNQNYSKITVGGKTKYIKTPINGEVPIGTSFYLDAGFTKLVGTVMAYSGVTYSFEGYQYSTVGSYYIPSPLYGSVNNGTDFFSDTGLTNKVGTVINNSSNIKYYIVDEIYSQVKNGSQSLGYISTPKTGVVSADTPYYMDEGKTDQRGIVGNYNVKYTFQGGVFSTVDLNSNTYYIATPQIGDIGEDMTYYTNSSLSNVGGIIVSNLNGYFFSTTGSGSGQMGVFKFNYDGNTYYAKKGSIGSTKDYYSVSYKDNNYGMINVNGGQYYVSGFQNLSYSSQLVGGTPITNSYFKVLSNRWDEEQQRLFIQPNINIKTDYTNPNEIQFENGVRIDIIKQTEINEDTGKLVDITFNKLDNTQWLLENKSGYYPNGNYNNNPYLPLSLVGPIAPPVKPQSDYKVYTDFMDSLPYALFYARTTPALQLQYRDYNFRDEKDFIDITNKMRIIGVRSIQFNTYYNAADEQGIKYYKYKLYTATLDGGKGELIEESEDIYSSELTWVYRGFQSKANYIIEIEIVDQYGQKFTTSANFYVQYALEATSILLSVEKDCDKHCVNISANAPEYVSPYYNSEFKASIYEYFGINSNNFPYQEYSAFDYFKEFEYFNGVIQGIEDLRSKALVSAIVPEDIEDFLDSLIITVDDLGYTQKTQDKEDYILIDKEKVLYYDSINNEERTKIRIPVNNTFLTQFKISMDFIDNIPFGVYSTKAKIFSYAYEEDGYIKPLTLYLNSHKDYFVQEIGGERKLVINKDKGNLQLYSKFYTYGEGTLFYSDYGLTTIAGMLGNFEYKKIGNVCVFKVGNISYYSDYNGETVEYLPSGSKVFRDEELQLQIGIIITDINSYNSTYGKDVCSFTYEQQNENEQDAVTVTYYIETPENCDEYGRKEKCFLVGNEYKDAISILQVLGNYDESWNTSKYTLALQDNPIINGMRKYTKYTNLPAPQQGYENYYFMLENPNGQSDYEAGLYIYNSQTGLYEVCKDNYIMVENLDMLNEVIPGWEEKSLTEKYNELNVPLYCRNEYGDILWQEADKTQEPPYSEQTYWVDGSFYFYRQIKERIEQKWISTYIVVNDTGENKIKCRIEGLDYRWGDKS